MRIRPASGHHREPEGVEVVLVETDDLAELADAVPGGDRYAEVLGPRGWTALDPETVPADAAVADDGTVPDGDGDPPAGRRRRARRWYVRRAAVGVGVVALLVVVVNVVEARRHDARIAALGEITGFLAPVLGPPTERWRQPGGIVGEASGLVMVSDAEGGEVRGVDPLTGAVRWSVDGGDGSSYCLVVDAAAWSPGASANPWPADRAADPDVLACFSDVPPTAEAPTAQTALVVLLDARTGTRLGQYPMPGSLVMIEPIGVDLVVGSVSAEGRLGVVRLDARSGEPRWSYTSPAAMFGREPLMIQSLDRRGDVLVVTALGGVLAISLTTGEAVDAEEAALEPATHEVTRLPDGGTAVWRSSPDGLSGRGQVTTAEGRRAYALTGPVQRPSTWDGSLPQTLVLASTSGSRLRGVNLRSGRQLWSTEIGPGLPSSPVVQVAGVMLLAEPVALTALDLRDGSILWTVPSQPTTRALTDGDLVLLTQRQDGETVLTAVALTDGTELWTSPLPEGTLVVRALGGRLVAETGTTVLGLG